ncbi:HAD-like domain-containing protein [Scheffersomyces xylosifermentans]|uniref:HAD-like domain-containing protein n=1 Tax=Scheffersomyces xylosifermentans TaxID=1304137 RepID=UPI00315D1A53
MDGTILDTEDLYTEAATELLALYGKGPMTWDVKLKLQGRPGPEAIAIMIKEYDLPLTPEEFGKISMGIQEHKWVRSRFLPGALELLEYLNEKNIPIALGTSSNTINLGRKTNHLKKEFECFRHHIVTGDDVRIPKGRGKPHPDIWLTCLESLNAERKENNLEEILPEECLIFEDGIPGVVSGIAAKAHVIWIPHEEALKVLGGEEHKIIGTNGEIISSLEHFDKEKYFL